MSQHTQNWKEEFYKLISTPKKEGFISAWNREAIKSFIESLLTLTRTETAREIRESLQNLKREAHAHKTGEYCEHEIHGESGRQGFNEALSTIAKEIQEKYEKI